MKIGVPKEIAPGETRVALSPESVEKLIKAGVEILVEEGAGEASGFANDAYTAKGAALSSKPQEIFACDVVAKVIAPNSDPQKGRDEVALLAAKSVLLSTLDPFDNKELLATLAEKKVTSFSLELVPRITRAQSMDILSSMSTLAGYKAVLLAAAKLPKMFPLMMTAAGTIPPAKVFVIGAGVAGLQAIATARRLGANVFAFDVRPAVREQVESLGGKFVQLDLGEGGEGEGGYARQLTPEEQEKQRQLMADTVADSDVVITTALVPGRAAPRLIEQETVERMRAGSVIVDLAAPTGGNCAVTRPGKDTLHNGVCVMGPENLPATMGYDASSMFSRNVLSFLKLCLTKEGDLELNLEDEVLAGSLATHDGAIVHPRIRAHFGMDEAPDTPEAAPVTYDSEEPSKESEKEESGIHTMDAPDVSPETLEDANPIETIGGPKNPSFYSRPTAGTGTELAAVDEDEAEAEAEEESAEEGPAEKSAEESDSADEAPDEKAAEEEAEKDGAAEEESETKKDQS